MKSIIFIFLVCYNILFSFSSCKKSYSCECKGYSTQQVEFVEYKTVSASNSKKADEQCIELGAYYDISAYSTNNIQFVNCNVQD